MSFPDRPSKERSYTKPNGKACSGDEQALCNVVSQVATWHHDEAASHVIGGDADVVFGLTERVGHVHSSDGCFLSVIRDQAHCGATKNANQRASKDGTQHAAKGTGSNRGDQCRSVDLRGHVLYGLTL